MIEEDDDFCDNDAQQVQVKSLQNIIRNALQLLSQMTSSGSDSDLDTDQQLEIKVD